MKSIGLSLFGMQDSAFFSDFLLAERSFLLEHAVLPNKRSEIIITGAEAAVNRIHTGISWPIESRISSGLPLRRAPLSFIWRSLVEAGDRPAGWRVSPTVSFPLSRIVAARVVSFLEQKISSSDKLVPVLAIPNHLDEYGQEQLLRELFSKGYSEFKLIWRPVAIALHWLKSTEGDFIPRRMHDEDHIHVVYMGVDAIEFTTLRLRHRIHQGNHYILPLRDRHHGVPIFSGLDWAEQLLKEYMPDMDDSAFWQAFSLYPEIWQILAGKNFVQHLRPWWRESKGWSLWHFPAGLLEKRMKLERKCCSQLKSILSPSCKLAYDEIDTAAENVKQFLKKKIRHMLDSFPEERLRGFLITGPLASNDIINELDIKTLLSASGLNVESHASEAVIDSLCIWPNSNGPVAEGANFFGSRIIAGIPAYLDTMPQLSILAKESAQYVWVPLLDAEEVLGGEEYNTQIYSKFRLNANQHELTAYLNKGDYYHRDSAEESSLSDLTDIPVGELSYCTARLIRHAVKLSGSFESAKNSLSRLDIRGRANDYAIKFADVFYRTYSQDDNNGLSSNPLRTPFRRAHFEFPVAPARDVNLDIKVRMKPASGLAKIDILPENSEFLRGHKVRLNYDKMQPVEQIPKMGRGWPRTEEIVCDPQDRNLIGHTGLVEEFEHTRPTAENYIPLINDIRDKILKGTYEIFFWGRHYIVNNIDHEGMACTAHGDEIIERVKRKFIQDFETGNDEIKERLFTRAAWLYTQTPGVIVSHIERIIEGPYDQKWNWAVQAGGRCFYNLNKYDFLFSAVSERIEEFQFAHGQLPIESVRGVSKILLFRKDGEKGLNRNTARLFAEEAVRRLKREEIKSNYKNLYFELIRFLLYLLRVRKNDNTCFQPDDSVVMKPFEDAMASMENAISYFRKKHFYEREQRTVAILDGFNQYLDYEGSDTILPTLNEAAGGF